MSSVFTGGFSEPAYQKQVPHVFFINIHHSSSSKKNKKTTLATGENIFSVFL